MTRMTLGTCAVEENDRQTICVVWSTANTDGKQVFAWHADAEFGREGVVERNEVAPELGAAALVKAGRKRLGRTVACRKRVPCSFAARLAVERRTPLKMQIEGVA